MTRRLLRVLSALLLVVLLAPPAPAQNNGGLFRLGSTGGGGPEADPNALHKAGGTMTGTITGFSTIANGDVLTIPACANDPNCKPGSIRFESKGPYDNAPWIINNTNSDVADAGGSDHVLGLNYNLRAKDDHGGERITTASHTVRVGFESRFPFGADPNTVRGLFEFNIDIDPNIGTSSIQPKRPFAFHWNMDSRALSTFQVGDPADANSAFFLFGNATSFFLEDNIFQIADNTVSGNNSSDSNTPGRIVFDPGFNADLGTQKGILFQNLFPDGTLFIRPGINGSTNGHVAIGYRPSGAQGKVFIGNTHSQPGLFIVNGSEDTYQINVLSHTTQNNPMIRATRNEAGTHHEVFTVAANGQAVLGDTSDPNHAQGSVRLLPADGDPTCSANFYHFYADNSETKMKLCNNGTRLDAAGVLSGSATLDFPTTALDTCDDLTITVTGAADGDVVSIGPANASVAAGSQFDAWVSGTNTVTVRHCCEGAANCDPGSGTFKARVFKP